ncbi:S8 family peptidase [Spongisporangium articulatum]|uniref:S8 family peptidase n=1 Tax=Spongisporangium articulatum TaxID=3362603 RepID=A0ABW8ANK0_9ACTN
MDDLLIDSADERLVLANLGEAIPQAKLRYSETDPYLGLTRLVLDLSEAQEGLQADAELVAEAAAAFPDGPVDGAQLAVTALRRWGARLTVPAPMVGFGGADVDSEPHVKGLTAEPVGGELVTGLPHVKGSTPFPEQTPVTGPWLAPGQPTGPRIGVADARPLDHPALDGRVSGDVQLSSGPHATWLPGHATFVTGLILKRAPDAQVVVRTVLEPRALYHSVPQNSVWDVARRLVRFVDDDVEVVNMSFATWTSTPPLPLARAVQRLHAAGIVLVAAGGNVRDDVDESMAPKKPYPAAFEDVTAVGSAAIPSNSPADDQPLVTSVDGDWLDLVAPGDDVTGPFLIGPVLPQPLFRADDVPLTEEEAKAETRSALLAAAVEFDGFAKWTGTSFAAAAVTGEIARLMSETGLSAHAALEVLRSTATGEIRKYTPGVATP